MNIANRLTLLRIILAFVCIGLIIHNTLDSLIAAFLIFIIASITDYLDGYFARTRNLISDLGKLLDPIADKILTLGVFLAFLELQIITAWMITAIMLREFIITGLRLYCLNKGVVMEAKTFGKHKTFSQIIGIVFIFIVIILAKLSPNNSTITLLHIKIIPLVMWYVVAITVGSGVHYLWVNRRTIKTF